VGGGGEGSRELTNFKEGKGGKAGEYANKQSITYHE
jgi:hypothetical protein